MSCATFWRCERDWMGNSTAARIVFAADAFLLPAVAKLKRIDKYTTAKYTTM